MPSVLPLSDGQTLPGQVAGRLGQGGRGRRGNVQRPRIGVERRRDGLAAPELPLGEGPRRLPERRQGRRRGRRRGGRRGHRRRGRRRRRRLRRPLHAEVLRRVLQRVARLVRRGHGGGGRRERCDQGGRLTPHQFMDLPGKEMLSWYRLIYYIHV